MNPLDTVAPTPPSLAEPSWTFTWFPRRWYPRCGRRLILTRTLLRISIAQAIFTRFPKKEQPLICPTTFVGNHRKNTNVEAIHMLTLDIDGPQSDPKRCVETVSTALGGVEVFAHSTFSSVPGAFRMRVLIPYTRPATATEHRLSCALVYRVLGRENLAIDEKCSDPARGFFIWRVPPSRAYVHHYREGHPWPIDDAAAAERRARLEKRRLRSGPPLGAPNVFERSPC